MIHPRLAFLTAKIFALAIIFTVSTVMAQPEGGVRGTITDATTGEALPGVNVVLEGTVLGTASAADGSFLIDHLKPGNYTLVASLLGYEKISRALTVQSAILTVDLNLAPKPVDIGEILVEDERVYSAASSRSVRKFDLQTRPNRSAQDMLQMAPGLIIAQHAGGGKAEQIFLRNFDADHGTDVALSVDGIPVNMVSHGHGQGYADMHFLIPDVVDGIDVHKGPYFVEYGNLAPQGQSVFPQRIILKIMKLGSKAASSAPAGSPRCCNCPSPPAGCSRDTRARISRDNFTERTDRSTARRISSGSTCSANFIRTFPRTANWRFRPALSAPRGMPPGKFRNAPWIAGKSAVSAQLTIWKAGRPRAKTSICNTRCMAQTAANFSSSRISRAIISSCFPILRFFWMTRKTAI
ncbi:MAG: TonB-dependent receptor [Calditrichia bacterium]